MSEKLLFDAPKDSPSHKARLKAFCEREHIWTHSVIGWGKGEGKWLAVILPSNRRGICLGYGETVGVDPIEYFAEFSRVIDEAGHSANGDTEREAVESLCRNLGIPFDLNTERKAVA